MEHTYLRYECADSFGLTTSSASSKAPQSNSCLAFLGTKQQQQRSRSPTAATLLTTAGSYCVGWSIRTSELIIRLGHREHLTGGVGTGRALNSDEIVCLDVAVDDQSQNGKIATGWVDGAIRIFDLTPNEVQRPRHGLIHSLLFENDGGEDEEEDEFAQREPLLLNGHGQSPVRTLSFDSSNLSRLASGGSDGSVVLWDTVAETGIFRLLGHRGGITDIVFVHVDKVDALITSSLDGLIKVWDLDAQCCTQTIASNRGEVWTATCKNLRVDGDELDRWRLIAGGNDGEVRVWSVETPKRLTDPDGDDEDHNDKAMGKDDVCRFIGYLVQPPNTTRSSEKVATVRYHPSGRFVGVLRANSKELDVFSIRTINETNKKRHRRLRRRRDKAKKQMNNSATKGKKRGLLDDPETSEEEEESLEQQTEEQVDPGNIKASDEFEWIASVRFSHKVRGFAFVPGKEKGELSRVVGALSTNALETHKIFRTKDTTTTTYGAAVNTAEKIASIDRYGHPTGIRGIALSSDDTLACTVSKSSTKIWNVKTRSLIQSLEPSVSTSKSKGGCYGLCTVFLPGNGHVVIGTREGHLLILDVASGEVVFADDAAHEGSVWSIDIKRPSAGDSSVSVMTGSADNSVKFWAIEEQEEDGAAPILVHQRTLQMTDDVVAVRYSNTLDSAKRLVFVASLDNTIKVFFDDSLKLFLSLYGHKLPVLAVDASDDDMLLASGGADKTVKIWGLDFGDTHRTLHGHQDSITDLRFVKRTHTFFTASKDGTLRYWDADRFQQVLILQGHNTEVNCLAVNRTGAFLLSGGMDRQIRVWERTKDIVFLEEERERELEQVFDNVSNRNEGGTVGILDGKDNGDDEGETDGNEPQSEAAVKKSIVSVSAGDRIMEALEQADQERKEIVAYKKKNPGKNRVPNPLLLGLEPAHYVLWVLKSIKTAELEQSLLLLPMRHVERLFYYLIVLLRSGRGVELCSRVAIALVKIHQSQVGVQVEVSLNRRATTSRVLPVIRTAIATLAIEIMLTSYPNFRALPKLNKMGDLQPLHVRSYLLASPWKQIVASPSLAVPLRELFGLTQLRLRQARDDIVGYNLAALGLVAKTAADRKQSSHFGPSNDLQDIWAGMGLGS